MAYILALSAFWQGVSLSTKIASRDSAECSEARVPILGYGMHNDNGQRGNLNGGILSRGFAHRGEDAHVCAFLSVSLRLCTFFTANNDRLHKVHICRELCKKVLKTYFCNTPFGYTPFACYRDALPCICRIPTQAQHKQLELRWQVVCDKLSRDPVAPMVPQLRQQRLWWEDPVATQ